MTLAEFKAWFEGFTEGIEAAPTEAQFAKIKAKVALIDGAPVTERIFVDRYWRPHWTGPYWYGGGIGTVGTWSTVSAGSVAGNAVNLSFATSGAADIRNAGYVGIDPATKGDNQTIEFDSMAALRELGRREAMN